MISVLERLNHGYFGKLVDLVITSLGENLFGRFLIGCLSLMAEVLGILTGIALIVYHLGLI